MKILSIIQNLAGGGGRVLNDVVLGLLAHENIVFYDTPLGMWSFGYGEELDNLGVKHQHVSSFENFCIRYNDEKPDIVLYHWWRGAKFSKPDNSKTPWIMIGHTQLPMPIGYDYYLATGTTNYEMQKHIPAEKKSLIFNGVDLNKFKNTIRKKKSDRFVLGRASHLGEPKISVDYIDFVNSLKIPNIQQIIIGDGPMYNILHERVKKLGISEKFEFIKKVKNSELINYLSLFDISCYLTSTHIETFSIIFLNKLALGIPIITQPMGGNIDQIIHNYNGFMSFHLSDLKRYCELLYKHGDLRERLSEGARESVKKFDIKIQHEAYNNLIMRLA